MSRFSGKCDFFDQIMISGLDYILSGRVYVGDSQEPLKLHCLADCVPYYPYVVSMSYMDNKDKTRGVIRLTDRSWVDIEAERYGEMGMHKYYRECLREELEKAEKEGAGYGNQS